MEGLDEILAEAVTAGGSRLLTYEQMLSVLEAGHASGLVLFTVDVVFFADVPTLNKTRPLPQWMFRLANEELETVLPDQVVPMALDFYRQHSSDPELTGASFEVFFEPAE